MTDTRYTIRDMAKRHDLTLRALRFYEQKGLLKPQRAASHATRYYSPADDARIATIVRWTRAGLSLKEVGMLLDWSDRGATGAVQRHLEKRVPEIELELTRQLGALASLRRELQYGTAEPPARARAS